MPISPINPLPLSSQIADQLRRLIVGGELVPDQRLKEQALSKELNVSRGPLREAIQQLSDEGLLVKEVYKGARVRAINQKELIELYSMRSNLEKFAFAEGWSRRTEESFVDLRARYDALCEAENQKQQHDTIRCEINFHNWIFEISDHSLLQASWSRLHPLFQIYLSVHHKMFGSSGAFSSMTREYLRLACSDDFDAMLSHLDVHFDTGFTEVHSILEDQSQPKRFEQLINVK